MSNKVTKLPDLTEKSVEKATKEVKWVWIKTVEVAETLADSPKERTEKEVSNIFWYENEAMMQAQESYGRERNMLMWEQYVKDIENNQANKAKEMQNDKEIKESLINSLWSDFHDVRRSTRKKMEDGTYEPRWKPAEDEEWSKAHGWTQEIDIANTKFEDLSPKWKKENYDAAKCAIDLVYDKVLDVFINNKWFWRTVFDFNTIENLSSVVHDERMKRNPRNKESEPEKFVPYNELPEEEKAKDRNQILQAIRKVAFKVYNK